jgi:rhamnogalacturonyl hydrolase YesR
MKSPRRQSAALPPPEETLEALTRANRYFMAEWPDPCAPIVRDITRPSSIWTRATYYEGLLALYRITHDPSLYEYAVRWASGHRWGMRNGQSTRNPDDQCCGQAYIELYELDPRLERISDITACIDDIVNSPGNDDWSWVDTLHMAMPVFAKLGVLLGRPAYLEKMHALYRYTKTRHGVTGLYNPVDHLWWRDKDFCPPYAEPNGKDCYWSRGNGWALAALARVLDVLPTTDPHREEYIRDLSDMAAALEAVQRDDGFWNVSLHDPSHFGGPESSGTSFFVFGIAWGINHGILKMDDYGGPAVRGWNALSREALHKDGFLGFVQGTAKQPSDAQPVTYDGVPNFDDFGVGAFLLAGSQVYGLAARM